MSEHACAPVDALFLIEINYLLRMILRTCEGKLLCDLGNLGK